MKRSATVAVTIAVAALAQAVVVLAARNPAIRAPPSRDDPKKVDVHYYYESLCPGCASFGANELDAAIGNLSEYMKLLIIRKSQPSSIAPLVSSQRRIADAL